MAVAILEELTLEPILRVARDIKQAGATLTPAEARYFVDLYYELQEFRKAAANQTRASDEQAEPNACLSWLADMMARAENTVKATLDVYTDHQALGRWAKSIVGVGPVISAGLLAHIDITQAPTVGHIWRFAGLDPTTVWAKGQKRPFNARLKVLCAFKLGESFVKVQNNPRDVYGHLYRIRKDQYMEANAAGQYREQAATILATKKLGKDTEAFKHYSLGVLPPAQIHARARRWVAKLFLAHYHHVAYELHYGEPPPKPYVLTHLGDQHVHYVGPPNWPMA